MEPGQGEGKSDGNGGVGGGGGGLQCPCEAGVIRAALSESDHPGDSTASREDPLSKAVISHHTLTLKVIQ